MTTNLPDFAQALEKVINYAREEGDTLNFTLAHATDEPLEISFVDKTKYELTQTTLIIREYTELEDGKSYFITYLLRLNDIIYCQVI